VSLSGNARRENLRGAFAVPEAARSAVRDCRVLLLDDVVTTGATAEAATRALLRGGARAVNVLALARVTTPTHALP
jgi:predicted amidophosphoribosyltransferase